MIGITTVLFDLDGAIIIQDPDLRNTQIDNFSRRVSRVATLDGGAAVSDFGMTDTDRTFVVAIPISHPGIETLREMMRLHSQFVISTHEGAFFAAANSFTVRSGIVIASFLITGAA